MNTNNSFNKKNLILYGVVILQIYVITFFIGIAADLVAGKEIFQEVKTFSPVNATCVNSEKIELSSRTNSAKVYNNTYEYIVNGLVYETTFYKEDLKGENQLLYYNPNNPEICSYYSCYSDILFKNSGRLVIAILMQMVIIVYGVWKYRNLKKDNFV